MHSTRYISINSGVRTTEVLHIFAARYSEEVLANLLVGKPDQCGRKFEVKVNDVLFVGHPMLLTGAKTKAAQPSPKRGRASLISFNIVFALAVQPTNACRAIEQPFALKRYDDAVI